MVLSIPLAFAVSKSESKYTGKAVMSAESDRMGFNLHWAKKCGFNINYNISKEVARLSWEDFKSFNSGWSGMNNRGSSGCTSDAKEEVLSNKIRYLEELKNKVNQELGISTSTQTALSGSSSNSLSSWTDTGICSWATYGHNSNNKKWKYGSSDQQYVQEAKRRGLSCGVGGSTQTASSGSSKLASYSNQLICQSAATLNSKKVLVWSARTKFQSFVKEAKRRGLSCGVGGSTQTASSGFSSNTNNNNLALQQANQKAQQSEQEAQKAKQLAQQAQSETEAERKKRIELEQQLAQLKSQQQKKQQQITQDNVIPLIAAMAYNDTDTNAIIEGIVTDNVEVAEVTVDNQLVLLNTDGSFQTNLYIPRNGKTVEIVAFDLKGNKAVKIIQLNRNDIEQASGPQFASLNPSGKRVKPNPNALALIIGVADYQETPAKAMYADSDAQIFYDYAMLKLGIPSSNIMELVNEGAEETDILLATKKWIARSTKQGESDIYLFFAGHGLASSDGEDMYLLPYDGSPELLEDTAILRDRLFKEVASSNPRSVTVFLDTCYSGTTRGTDMLIASRPIAIVAKEQAIPDNFTVFTAAAGDQTAKPLEEAKHGMFSYFLMKGMEGEADADNDNAITAGELHAYVQKNVIQQSSGSQTPELQGDANRVLVRFQ